MKTNVNPHYAQEQKRTGSSQAFAFHQRSLLQLWEAELLAASRFWSLQLDLRRFRLRRSLEHVIRDVLRHHFLFLFAFLLLDLLHHLPLLPFGGRGQSDHAPMLNTHQTQRQWRETRAETLRWTRTLTMLGDWKWGFSYSVGPPKLPWNILMRFKTKRGPISTRDASSSMICEGHQNKSLISTALESLFRSDQVLFSNITW